IHPEVPLVGTGMEQRAAWDSGHVVFAAADGVVVSVTGDQITTEDAAGQRHVHALLKFRRTNQGTCQSQRPLVSKGDLVTQGQPIADGSSTDQGELALGQSVLCAFMIFEGYNFEDAIIISERVAQEDKFSSVHIEKHEIEARETKLGPEEITRDIPNVGEESLRDLDEYGIIRIGAEVGPGDILVGKITPKGETELTPEEKLLRAIFGEKAREVKDTSLRVPHGEHGKVINVRVFSREQRDELPAGVNQLVQVSIAQRRKVSEGDKMAGRHGNKGVIARIMPVEDMPYLADGTPVDIILNPIGVPSRMNVGQVLETHLGRAAKALGFRVISPVFDGAESSAIEDALARTWVVDQAVVRGGASWGADGLPQAHIADAKQWLQKQDYDADRVFDESVSGYAKEVCERLWLEEEGFASRHMGEDERKEAIKKIYADKKLSPPTTGKVILYDGRTGEPFDQAVTVGHIYMMKLVHLVEDKIHARSTGPYSLITQQPLGGKAQFGGQRFGEMEVWALEAYGAAHILQELLTVKSDDVVGRVKTYEAIVKGESIIEAGVPESFKVLVKELQSLGLSVEVLNDDDERVAFAEDSGLEVPDLGIDLTGLEKGEF
ncbi:MAG TPA: DNA-directed RNA polymerase subunit beta, partial [Dehalococcoidia bacterium]|nr:DNA-directed RNA polymerase subunit beta [Dehalococcoidia bacterium]